MAAEEKSQLTIRANGDVLPGVNPRDRLLLSMRVIGLIHAGSDRLAIMVLQTVVPSVREGGPIRVIHKAEDALSAEEYRLYENEQDSAVPSCHLAANC